MMMNMFFDTALKEDNLNTPESNVEPSVRSLLRNNGEHVYCVVSIIVCELCNLNIIIEGYLPK